MASSSPLQPASAHRHPLLIALALSLGAAISLGISRFSYALLLPPMREDLGWSYLLAGTMNTANAIGYFAGALLTPAFMRRFSAQAALIAGALLTGGFMFLSGFTVNTHALFLYRVLAGVASAFVFISGGVLATRLSAQHAERAGLLIGVYYGGTGFGIILSALLVPLALQDAGNPPAAHAWQWAWLALGVACILATLAMVRPAGRIDGKAAASTGARQFRIGAFRFGLAGYFLFGFGYIGYMTFVIALLKEQGMTASQITVFYAVLGSAVVASSRIWAGLLDRFKGGEPLAILNALLGVAVLLPVASDSLPAVFASGVLFGAVFLSIVAATTALVRHNLPPAAWSAGISLFTTVFAFGQIIGPSVIGLVSDLAGGLQRGLVFSAAILFSGAALARRQRPLPRPMD